MFVAFFRGLIVASLVVAALPVRAVAAETRAALPGAAHDPPVFLDETNALVTLVSRGQGYGIRAYVRVAGFSSKSDALRLEWTQGGKLLATAKCEVGSDLKRKRAWGTCQYDDKLLTAKGPIEGRLVYWDDQQEKEYLVRTFKVNVKTWSEIGKATLFQIVPDDLLGAAFARVGYTNQQETEVRPEFVFWATTKALDRHAALRCTVDGKKLEDFETFFDAVQNAEQVEADHTPKSGPHVVYRWEHVSITPKNLFVGPKEEVQKHLNADAVRLMIDNPGKWECQLRNAGKAVRTFLFTVNANGMIEPDEMQTGVSPLPTLPGTVLIDMRIPKDDALDTRVRPDAMKKSMGYGLPWPDHPKVKAIQAAFPPASGLPDP